MTYFNLFLDYSTNPEEKTSFVVFDTNYESYAGVYVCSKTPTGFTHYIAIVSRSSVDFDKENINKLLVHLHDGHISPADFRLNHVDHRDCNYDNVNENSNDENVINKDGKVYVTIKWIHHAIPLPNP
ncbi:uncharacterized protein LOC126842487 [Adelges cooleyi]|uniref:uncharacterized protein LOC126833113 n=1 Tax=Adelges cooleyi TaxID=133065 RepID=UPI00217F4494|nr:uncharacterized protein LOC126833113 [Adelges cooleyi]XP_050431595.1 uncharacterized protein LOC126840131 [Adelges cooleyi]XP_050435456.1 uncharacterized protein LOC126842487 [Adelges cooleyi]